MIIVLILWAVLNVVLLYWLVSLMSRQKNKAEPVSHTDRLTHNEDYSEKLLRCATELDKLSEEMSQCQQLHDDQSDPEKKAELFEKLERLKKRHAIMTIKCSGLLKKLD